MDSAWIRWLLDSYAVRIPAVQAVSKPLSLWERVAEGRGDPSQTQPLSLWERVAEGRVRVPKNPAAPIHCR